MRMQLLRPEKRRRCLSAVRRQAASLEGIEVVGPADRRRADEGLALSLSPHGGRMDESET